MHASVAVRVTADLAWLRLAAGMAAPGNVTALLLFIVVAVVTAYGARRPASTPDCPRPPGATAAVHHKLLNAP